MKRRGIGSTGKRTLFWVSAAIIIAMVPITWSAHHRSDDVLNNLKSVSIFTAAPAPRAVLLAEGSGEDSFKDGVRQNPAVAKAYAVSGQSVGDLVGYYEQTYPSYSYRWKVNYRFTSPGVSAVNLFGVQGAKDIAIYLAPTPYKPKYPALSFKQAPSSYATYITIVVSEKR